SCGSARPPRSCGSPRTGRSRRWPRPAATPTTATWCGSSTAWRAAPRATTWRAGRSHSSKTGGGPFSYVPIMATDPKIPTLFPVLRYQDATGVIRFLEDALGFTAEVVHRDDAGRVVHAVLGRPGGAVMLSEARGEATSPYDLGPTCLYVVVD